MKQLPVYTIPQFENSSGSFYVNTLKNHLKNHHFINAPHKHDFYLCVIFTQGKGRHEIDFITYNVKPGSVFFLSPGSMHSWELSDDADGYIFFHSRDFYDVHFQSRGLQDLPFYYSAYNPPVISSSLDKLKGIVEFFQMLLKEHISPGVMSDAKLCSLVDLIYIDLSRIYYSRQTSSSGNTSYIIKMKQLEKLIDDNYLEKRSPSEYAGMMNMSLKHLNRIVNATLKKTVTDMIADRLVLEAKRLLVRSTYTVSEISDRLGFADNSYFSRFFKKRTGDSPLEFFKRYNMSGN